MVAKPTASGLYILEERALKALLIITIWTEAVGGVPNDDCAAIRKAIRDLLFFDLVEGKTNHSGAVWRVTQKGREYLEENVG